MGFLDRLLGKKKNDSNEIRKNTQQTISHGTKVTVNLTSETDAFAPDIPKLQGDYAKAIFLNAYSLASPVKAKTEYQSYLLYECGIRDAAAYHRTLITDGYLTASTLADKVSSLRVTELKLLLNELGEPVSGKKDALIQRALANGNADIISKYCTQDTYSISEKGVAFLQKNEDYVRLHKHRNWNIDWHEYNSHKRPGYSFYDIIWGILNERILHSNNFGRNEYFAMYELLLEEIKRENALTMLLRVLYLDLSGVEYLGLIDLYRSGIYAKKELIDNMSASIFIASGIIHPITNFKDIYTDLLVDRVYEQKLPIQICDKATFLDIVHSVLNGTFDEDAFQSV